MRKAFFFLFASLVHSRPRKRGAFFAPSLCRAAALVRSSGSSSGSSSSSGICSLPKRGREIGNRKNDDDRRSGVKHLPSFRSPLLALSALLSSPPPGHEKQERSRPKALAVCFESSRTNAFSRTENRRRPALDDRPLPSSGPTSLSLSVSVSLFRSFLSRSHLRWRPTTTKTTTAPTPNRR